MTKLFFLVVASLCVAAMAGGDPWDHIGPWNIFDDKNDMGESGTLASAASPFGYPHIIYAGGSNNEASTGILKTVDWGKHWTRNSDGLWDTRIKGVWVHPDDYSGDWVFAGTLTGVYESTDGAASWKLKEETKTWGTVTGFDLAIIYNQKYVIAASTAGVLTMPREGGTWNIISWPEGESVSEPVSVVTQDDTTTLFMCSEGGSLYSLDFSSPTTGTWSEPLGGIQCANVAVDPNDRKHLIYTKVGEYQAYESTDAGQTSQILPSNPPDVFYVMIDHRSSFYTASEAGAYVSHDGGKSWSAYHVIVNERSGAVRDRVAHDYQRIIKNFRGHEIAFPSDQGLHIVNRNSPNLTSAVGDMTNCIAINLAVSPGDQDGPRKLVVTMFDWSAVASWDDGATWPSWDVPTEKDIVNPNVGEGGGTMAFGKSGHVLMWRDDAYWHSDNGGKNLTRATVPGSGALAGTDYFRQEGSRSEPLGTVFSLVDIPVSEDSEEELESQIASGATEKHLLVSEDYGVTWTTKALPEYLQDALQVACDPTYDRYVYVVTPDCLTYSQDKGLSWAACLPVPTEFPFTGLTVINPDVVFLSRGGEVPLRTTDGAYTWTELTSAASLFKYGAALSMSASWSGNTLVLHGVDHSAIERGAFGTSVFKSTNNGDDWTDETGDMVTISLGEGVWYEKDFYMTSSGEGIMVKRNFEA